MSFWQELTSWNPFNSPQSNVKDTPTVGNQAPSTSLFKLPREDGKPVILSFLRHCGCPFAEKIFRQLRDVAEQNPNVHCVAISHSNKSATDKWLEDVGGSGKTEVLVDDQMQTFAEYGLGYSSIWAVLNPSSLSTAMNIGKKEGIDIRPTESGSRWQTAGLFAVDGHGKIAYSHPAKTSDDLGDLKEALQSIK